MKKKDKLPRVVRTSKYHEEIEIYSPLISLITKKDTTTTTVKLAFTEASRKKNKEVKGEFLWDLKAYVIPSYRIFATADNLTTEQMKEALLDKEPLTKKDLPKIKDKKNILNFV